MRRPRDDSNPSIGLKIWGPLVPASDCKKCLATLTGVQFAAGALLWLVPGRRPPPTRTLARNRLIKLGGVVVGAYLMFTAATETARLLLPYDPWVEDAAKARAREDVLRTPQSRWSPDALRYAWFGPTNYHAIPWTQWRERTVAYLRTSENVRNGVNKMLVAHKSMVYTNMTIAREVVAKIHNNELSDAEPSEQDMQAVNAFADEFEEAYDQEEIMDLFVIKGDSLWEVFEPDWESFVNIVPRATKAFLPEVVLADDEAKKTQSVNYLPIAQVVKRH